jgi:hypothetical protein
MIDTAKVFGFLDMGRMLEAAQPLDDIGDGLVPCTDCHIIGPDMGSRKYRLCSDHQILLDRLIRGSVTSSSMEWPYR